MQMFQILIIATSKKSVKTPFHLSMLENGKMQSYVCSKCFVNIAQWWGGAKCMKAVVFQEL